MTREEAKTRLIAMKAKFEMLLSMRGLEISDVFDVAIEALSAEPCEDAISRAEAIRIASGYCHWTNIPDELAKLPPVTPKQRIGHWVKISPAGIYECSECGQNVMTGDIDAYRHCHGCGAKMSENPTGSNSSEKPNKWIPVSERLPEAGEYVGDGAKYYLVQNEYGDMLVARYTHSEYWEQMYQIKPYSAKIVAWMPLPEPYEIESED